MYIQLNSQVICYEKSGQGRPVILLHGNNGDLHDFDELVEVMKPDYTVYAMDTRGHGESATPKEYHYADMATDVINLIEALDIDKPYLIGYSDGAIIALLVAIKASRLLSGIICCGANLTPAGIHHRDLRDIKKEYKRTNDPKIKLMLDEPNISTSELNDISVPAMIIAGERDMIKEKETKKIADNIRASAIQILPGESHSSYIVKSAKLYPYIRSFLS